MSKFRFYAGKKRISLESRTIPNVFSPVNGNDASTMVRSPSHIQARLAASSSIRVSRFCLHFPRGFRQLLALGEQSSPSTACPIRR